MKKIVILAISAVLVANVSAQEMKKEGCQGKQLSKAERVEFDIKRLLMFIVGVIFVRSIVMNCSYVFVGLGKSIYSLFFVILNLILVTTFITLFTSVFALASLGIFLGFILSYTLEAILMLVLVRKMLSDRIWNLELAPQIDEIKKGNHH